MSPMKLLSGALAGLLMSVLVAACGTPSDDASPPATRSAAAVEPTSTASASPAPDRSRTADPSPSQPATPRPVSPDPPGLALESVATGLADPINVAAAPEGWLLVNERAGRIVAVDPRSGETAVALDIRDRVIGEGERGLLGLALHPGWPEVPRAFVHYSDRDGDTVLAEFAAGDPSGPVPRLDPASERVLLQVDQPYPNHNGGQLAFGPDGRLWIGLGDGGSGGDPHGNGQNSATLLGSILRLDVDEPGETAIPDDNPFADGGGAPEVVLYGLRNPWRFSFDRLTGALWIADVGQNAYEEVNRLDPVADAGANLGWNVMEASHCFADAGCSTEGLVVPVSEYGRDLGCSITGGYVYRGSAMPDLDGWYLFADYCTGRLFGVPSDVDELTAPRELLATGTRPSAFGQDAGGELYLADLAGGTVYRIVPGG